MKEIINRKNHTQFDPGFKIPYRDIMEILSLAGKSPSAWNLQHWHFDVIESYEAKRRLLPIAYYQKQVLDASAVITVHGNLMANRNFDNVYNPLVSKGFLPEKVQESLRKQVERAFESPDDAFEHACINASMAAMTLVYAAMSKGYDTGIIGGFDKRSYVENFGTPEKFFPIMLIPIGQGSSEPHHSERLNIDQITTWL